MSDYHLEITSRARRDLRQTFVWLAARSPEGAVAWRSAAYHAIISIELNPMACSIAPEARYSKTEFRNQFFHTRKGNNYRFLFYVDGMRIFVTHMRSPGQRLVRKRDLPQ